MSSYPTARREVASWTRWLHIYLSMFSFGMLLFFAITGITLNHPSWSEGMQKVDHMNGTLPVEILPEIGAWPQKQLAIVEYFRNTYNIKSQLKDLRLDDSECTISFKGPGFSADAFIDVTTGNYEVTITNAGVLAIVNDLHKCRDTGSVWPIFIDISAAFTILVSLTGFIMIFFIKKRRSNGLLLLLIGIVLLMLSYYLFV